MTGTQTPADRIVVAGHDLVEDLMGRTSYATMTHLVMTGGRLPSAGVERMIDALLVTFTDHGVTPSSLATRLTLLGAPEALQSAVAAGLCGAGSRYLGTMADAAGLLRDTVAKHPQASPGEQAASIVASARAAHEPIPGLGHPEHKHGDPRVPRLLELAEENDVRGQHCELLLAVPGTLRADGGPSLPVNAAGLAGALIADMGFGPSFARGLALVSRCAGLVGQALAEMREPEAQSMWDRERDRALHAQGQSRTDA